MQSIVSLTSSLLSQQGHVLSAYLAVLAIFQFGDRKNALQMARLARHAAWSAGLVITVHSPDSPTCSFCRRRSCSGHTVDWNLVVPAWLLV